MAYHTFGPGLALDKITMKGIPATVAQLVDAETGLPVQAYTMDEIPVEMVVITNRYGYFGQFRTDSSVRRLRLTFGGLTLENSAWELLDGAAAAAIELERLTISNIALDTDGTPYYSPGSSEARIMRDTDGTPYYVSV